MNYVLLILSLVIFLTPLSSSAYTETKTGSNVTSKLSGFVPNGGIIPATPKDINKYFSVSDAELTAINTCNVKKAEADAYYNSAERTKCQSGGVGSGDICGGWSWVPMPPAEKANCDAKEALLKEFMIAGYDGGGCGGGTSFSYYNTNYNCSPNTFAASSFGLGDGYLSKGKIDSFIGYYNQGKLRIWLAAQNKLCFWREVPWWYHTNCYEFNAKDGFNFSCSHENVYNHTFEYKANQQGQWASINKDSANKCEQIKVAFGTIADFSAHMQHNRETGGTTDITNYYNSSAYHVPPTNIASCTGQADCLGKGKEYEVVPGGGDYAKGVLRVPDNYIASVEGSLTGSDDGMSCTGGVCVATKTKKYSLAATIPDTFYYGQCRGDARNEMISGASVLVPSVTVNTDEVKIPTIVSTLNLTVQNRPPVATVSFEKDSIKAGETVKAYCDVIDPDDCVDKIVKIKWKCKDNDGNNTNCFFLDQNQVYRQGELFKEVTPANPYRDTTDLKVTAGGAYAVTCEAWDSDGSNALSGMGVKSITVNGPVCIADGVCNRECPNDPDCGVIPEGSCFVTRIKPSYEIKKIKPKTAVTYQAQIFGGITPIKYTWFCDKNEAQKDERMSSEKKIEHTCDNYMLDNHTYEPKAMYSYKKEDGSIGETECKNNDGTAVTTSGIAPSKPGFCMIVPEKGGSDISSCGDKVTANFKVYSNYQLGSPQYVWGNCPKADGSVPSGSAVSCDYSTVELSEKFTPTLTIKDSGEEIKCPSSTSVSLYREASCNVVSRVKDSGEDYSSTVKASIGETLESKIERKCLDPKETITWTATNAILKSQDNDTHTASLNIAGETIISAKAKVGGKDITCKPSNITVKEKIEIGQ